MEPADEHTLPEDVPLHRFEDVGAGRIRRQLELRVEREQLERVVVVRAGRGRAGTHVARGAADVLGLDGPVRHCRRRRHGLGQPRGGPGDVEHHPVQHVVGVALQRDVGVVEDQREGHGACGHVGPVELGRHAVGVCARVFGRDLGAVGERRRRQRETRARRTPSASRAAGRRARRGLLSGKAQPEDRHQRGRHDHSCSHPHLSRPFDTQA